MRSGSTAVSATVSVIVARLRRAGCVFAEDEAALLITAARDGADLEEMLTRRVAGLPLEQVIGYAEFCGLRIALEPGVFVPRHRTEFLVQQAIRLAKPGDMVVDLCCGAGAIGAGLLASVDGITLHAADVDPTAVRCARRNLTSPAAHVSEGDLFDALPASLMGTVNVLVANAPYVPTDQIPLLPPEAREYEPLGALDGGRDGLDVHRRISAAAPRWLSPGGHLLTETTERQAALMVGIMRSDGLVSRVVRSDEWSATVVIGRRTHSS